MGNSNSAAKTNVHGHGQYTPNSFDGSAQAMKPAGKPEGNSPFRKLLSPRGRRSLDASKVASPGKERVENSPRLPNLEPPLQPPTPPSFAGKMAASLSPQSFGRKGVSISYSCEQPNTWPQYAVSSVQGQRQNMEDDHCVIPKVRTFPSEPRLALTCHTERIPSHMRLVHYY
jgi:hypothetical protein